MGYPWHKITWEDHLPGSQGEKRRKARGCRRNLTWESRNLKWLWGREAEGVCMERRSKG